jgi:hypothetical protein
MLTAWAEGVMFDTIAGAGSQYTPTIDDVRTSLSEYLHAILPGGSEPGRSEQGQPTA